MSLAGTDPGFLKRGGGSILGLQAKKRGGGSNFRPNVKKPKYVGQKGGSGPPGDPPPPDPPMYRDYFQSPGSEI